MIKMNVSLILLVLNIFIGISIQHFLSQNLLNRNLNNPTSWYGWLSDSDYKYCTFNSLKNWCLLSDMSHTCNPNNLDVSWSNELDLTGNSKYSICPENTSICGTKDYSLHQSSSSQQIAISDFTTPNNPICSYKIAKSDDSFESINLRVDSLKDATVEVYLETSSGTSTYIQSVSAGNAITKTLDSGQVLLVIVIFDNFPAEFDMTATTSASTSDIVTSSECTHCDTSDEDGSSATPIGLLITGGLIGFVLLFLLASFVYCFFRCKRMKSRKTKSNSQIHIPEGQDSFNDLRFIQNGDGRMRPFVVGGPIECIGRYPPRPQDNTSYSLSDSSGIYIDAEVSVKNDIPIIPNGAQAVPVINDDNSSIPIVQGRRIL